jgi:hypothetical protein
LHHLQQGRLDLGRRAVDLVRQQQVGEDRPQFDAELARLVVEDARADQIGGHQIGGELDAAEGAADHLGQRLDRHRLGQAGHALEQDVAAGQQGDQQPLQQAVLAHDQALEFEEHVLHHGRRVAHGVQGRRIVAARHGGHSVLLGWWVRGRWRRWSASWRPPGLP